MSIELQIARGLATLKLNLGKFLAIAQQIAGVTKHREAHQALLSVRHSSRIYNMPANYGMQPTGNRPDRLGWSGIVLWRAVSGG